MSDYQHIATFADWTSVLQNAGYGVETDEAGRVTVFKSTLALSPPPSDDIIMAFAQFLGYKLTWTYDEKRQGWVTTVRELTTIPPSSPGQPTPMADQSVDVMVMRAGESIWHLQEPEGTIVPGKRRPILILDENTVHLANTTKRLTPELLLKRVQAIITHQEVPIRVELSPAVWIGDLHEQRSRLVAYLTEHSYSDLKMIMGVDYMGQWASIHLQLGIEPEALPAMKTVSPPPLLAKPAAPPYAFPIDGIISLIAGAILLFVGLVSLPPIMVVGGLFVLYGIGRLVKSRQRYDIAQAERAAQYEQALMASRVAYANQVKQAQDEYDASVKIAELSKAIERITRTYKVDDMRLFCTAMKAVFQAVVDDIVEQGAHVVRVEGGHGGYFTPEADNRPMTSRRTDAAESLV